MLLDLLARFASSPSLSPTMPAKAKVPKMFAAPAKGGARLSVGCVAAMRTCLLDGRLPTVVGEALNYVGTLPALTPQGLAASVRTTEDIIKVAGSKATTGSGAVFAGAFDMLDLKAAAIPGQLDTGRIEHCLTNITHVDSLAAGTPRATNLCARTRTQRS